MKTITAIIILFFCLNQASIAEQAIDFELPSDNGNIKLSNYRGKVVYLDFWASWCPPCLASFPWMNKIQYRYKDQGLVVIAISLDEDIRDARKFLKKMKTLFNIAYDPKGSVANAYKVELMPTSFVIDRKGNILYMHEGFNPEADNEKNLESKIIKALASR